MDRFLYIVDQGLSSICETCKMCVYSLHTESIYHDWSKSGLIWHELAQIISASTHLECSRIIEMHSLL